MKKILLTLAISTFSLAIQASELSYSYVQVGYVTGDVENFDVDGFDFTASLAISDSFFVNGGYSRIEDDDDIDFEVDSYSVGLGFHVPITAAADVVFGASWIRADADVCYGAFCGSEDDNGYGIDAGIRWLPLEQLEVGISLGYVDIADNDDTQVVIGGRYFFTNMLSLGAGYSSANDVDSDLWDINFRYSF